MTANETAKPKLRITSDRHAFVTYRGFKGEIFTDRGGHNWRAVIEGGPAYHRCFWNGENALTGFCREVDRLAEIREALVAADRFMEAGGLAALESRLQGARGQFERLIAQLHKHDDAAVAPVVALIKVGRRRKGPKFVEVKTDRETVKIWPGLCISVHGDAERYGKDHGAQTYWIGDLAEYDSFNLHYFGTIEKITAKTVTIKARGEKTKRLKIARFAWRNARSVAVKSERNRETSYYI